MKLALILPLLFGGLTGALSYGGDFLNEVKQVVLKEVTPDSDTILTAYIDGEKKVYLNNIYNSDSVDDKWECGDVKTVSVFADFSEYGDHERYLVINLPLGLRFNSAPENFVDGKNVLSVNLDNFKQTEIPVTNASNYYPDCGTVIFEIAKNVTALEFDFMVSIDQMLFNYSEEDVVDSSSKALTISIANRDSVVSSVKLDKVKSIKSYNPWTSGGIGEILNNTSKRISVFYHYADPTRISSKLTFELENPYVLLENGDKIYLDIDNIVPDKGNYSLISDNVYKFEWNNIKSGCVRIDFDLNVSGEGINGGESIYLNLRNLKEIDTIHGKEYLLKQSSQITGKVVSSDKENLTIKTINKNLYKGFDKGAIYNLGQIQILNPGVSTGPKKLRFKFPSEYVSVKTFIMPTLQQASCIDISVIIVNNDTGTKSQHDLILNKPEGTCDNQGYVLTISEILDILGINTSDEYSIDLIEYNIESFPSEYYSSRGDALRKANSGNYYGKALATANVNDRYTTVFEIEDISGTNNRQLFEQYIYIKNDKEVRLHINNATFIDNSGVKITDIEAGDSFAMKGIMDMSDYGYGNATAISSPVVYVKLPKGFELDIKRTFFEAKNSSENISFEVLNRDNPRELSDGSYCYEVRLNMEDKLIGWFKENLDKFEHVLFNIGINTKKSIKTMTLDFSKTLLFDDCIAKFTTGTPDIYDLNNNGDVNEKLAHSSATYLNIISNSNWLNTDTSIKFQGEPTDNLNVVIGSDSEVLDYNLNINNDCEGYVRPGRFEYYIPIPKKNLIYNTNIKDENEVFNFNMVLTEKVLEVNGFDATYSYDNINFIPYDTKLDLSKVSMIKIINTKDISPGDTFVFSIKMNYEEGSWDGSSKNDVIWSAYGNQIYEKNEGESGYLHIMDKIKIEIAKAPIINENLSDISVKFGDTAYLKADANLGIPLSDIKWQYRESFNSIWNDLNEITDILTINNVRYDMNGYQYRYEVTNKYGTVISNAATLTVIDSSVPIIKLTELKEGDNYKIQINVIDDNKVSHIILPDGTRIDGDTYIIDAIPNTKYIFKAYDLTGNEAIAEITILTGLTPRTVSSNLDIYIKSQNMLSMSLNTNSITFDDYSGAEDMEMLGAVTISINSSLPYDLNAYMSSEITNSDKSKIMPTDILNIRESSETTYQTFNNTTDKIVVKNDCIKGNNNSHNIDLKLSSNQAHKADVYKTVIKFEAEQK